MPLKSKRSPPKKKPQVKVRARPQLRSVKQSAKVAAKPKIETKSSAKDGSSIFWKILAERERRKEKFPPKQGQFGHRGTKYPEQVGKHEQFARFAGPKRRAA